MKTDNECEKIQKKENQNEVWGGRFRKNPDKRAIKFNSSILFDYVLYKYDILGSIAHVKMLAKQNLLTNDEAKLICTTLKKIESEFDNKLHFLDAKYEDIHMFIEHLLIKKIGDVGKKIHTGRSRNDQVALDLRLYSREAFYKINKLLNQFIRLLQKFSKKYKNNLMPGYTHLQQAQPISLGQYIEAYLSMFSRDISRLKDWYKRMNFSPLGAGSLAGSNLPIDRDFVAKKLKFSGIIKNTIDAVSDRDYIIEFCSIASIIMMHLSRLSEDLILWSTQEFNFVTIDDAFATGSSLMPNKKNPDILELIRGKSGRVFGHLISILTIMKGLPLAYNKDMQEDKEALFDTVNTLKICLEIIFPFLNSLNFNLKLMQQKTSEGLLNATELLENLILKGVPFREAHNQIGLLVKQAISKNCNLNEILKHQKNAGKFCFQKN